jgi:hypothetical protein
VKSNAGPSAATATGPGFSRASGEGAAAVPAAGFMYCMKKGVFFVMALIVSHTN